MSIQATLNPYPLIGSYYSMGLDYVINNIPAATIDDLVNTVYAYINGLSWFASTPGSLEQEIKSVAYSSINSFCNGQCGSLYGGSQKAFVNMMTGPSFTNYITVDTLNDRILDIQDNLTKSGLSVEQQTPLLLATQIGATAYSYFIAAFASPGNWTTYFNAALVSATGNLPFWNAAAMQGTLIGAKSTFKGMIAPTTDAVSNEMIQSLIGALTITVGKVIFKWIPRMQNNGMAMSGGCGCH